MVTVKIKFNVPVMVALMKISCGNGNTDSQNENFFFLHEQISNFLKGHDLLVTNRPKKISLVCTLRKKPGIVDKLVVHFLQTFLVKKWQQTLVCLNYKLNL